MKYWIVLTFAIAANVTANMALKLAAQKSDFSLTASSLGKMLSQPWLWVAVGSAFLLFAAYFYAIKGIDLALAYAVVTSLALVSLIVLSTLVFGADFGWQKGVGATLVIAGILVMAS